MCGQGKDTEAQKYLAELDRAKEQATSAKHERDQIMLTLKQKQLETQRANEDAQQLRDKEMKLQSELSRLRGHLVQVSVQLWVVQRFVRLPTAGNFASATETRTYFLNKPPSTKKGCRVISLIVGNRSNM